MAEKPLPLSIEPVNDSSALKGVDERDVDLYRPTLSLIMIVKNEADNLPELLGPLQGKFDQIVVVDTGSDDGTPEVARRYGAEVYFFPWINDFSAARNESIRHARCDWCFWLDGDDRMDPDEVDLIRKIIIRYPKKDSAFFCRLRSYGASWTGDQNLMQIRLFPNVPGIGFEGAVHERIGDSILALGIRLEHCPVEVVHTGYVDPAIMPAKFERNLELMNRMLEKNPDDVSTRFQLIMQLVPMGRIEESKREIETLAKVLDEKTSFPANDFYRFLLIKGIVCAHDDDPEGAKRCYERILELHPDLGVAHYLLARAYYDERDWKPMMDHILKAEYHGIQLDAIPIPMTQAYFDLASMRAAYYLNEGKWVLAAQEFRKALNINAEFVNYYVTMGNAYLRDDNVERALHSFETGLDVYRAVMERIAKYDETKLPKGFRGGTVEEMSEQERHDALASLYDGIAICLMKQARLTKARTVLEEAVKALPKNATLALRFVEWMLRMKRRDGATRWANRTLELAEDSRVVYGAVVNIYLLYGQAGDALPWLRRLWRRFPHQWDSSLIAVLTALQTGNWVVAREQLGEMLDYLIETGVAEAKDWGRDWQRDHPLLDYFADIEAWTARLEKDSDSETGSEPFVPSQAKPQAEKMAAIATAIREVLRQALPLMAYSPVSPR